MKKSSVFIMTVLMLGSLCVSAVYGGGEKASGQGVKEAAAPKAYPAVFTAKGTAADSYNQKLEYIIAETIRTFTERGEAAKITGYDTPVKVRVALIDNAGLQTSMAAWKEMYGESMEYNRYNDALKRLYNIDVSPKFVSSEYTQQLRLDMASNDLPDIFFVDNQKDLIDMVEAGVIRELGSLRSKYASSLVEEVWTSHDSPLFDMASHEGKYYGLPKTWPDTDYLSYLWIRSDWLKALNLQPPKTMDDLTKIIEAFVNADFDKNGIKDTVGIAMQKNLYDINYRGVFSAYRAYPEFWIVKNGSLAWGGIDENCKNALRFFNDLYKRGFIDKEFISYEHTDMFEAVINGKCGIWYSPHNLLQSIADLHDRDPNADFWAVPLPTADGKAVKQPLYPHNLGWTVVNSKFANPEIAYKMFNFFASAYNSKDGTWWTFDTPVGGGGGSDYLGRYASHYSAGLNYDAYEGLTRSYKAGWDTSKLNAAAMIYYGPINTPASKWGWDFFCNPELPNNAFQRLKEVMDAGDYFYDGFLGVPSNYMAERWQSIRDEQQVAFTRIITGDVDVDRGFAAWIQTFSSMGGDRITREVNDWFKSQKK
jgi:putative aldouronate transport system substrate-binding protein